MSRAGHNSGSIPDGTKAIVERIERLNQEKSEIAEAIKDVYAEAKSNGHDTKVLRAVIKRRAEDEAEREEFETSVDTYLAFLMS